MSKNRSNIVFLLERVPKCVFRLPKKRIKNWKMLDTGNFLRKTNQPLLRIKIRKNRSNRLCLSVYILKYVFSLPKQRIKKLKSF